VYVGYLKAQEMKTGKHFIEPEIFCKCFSIIIIVTLVQIYQAFCIHSLYEKIREENPGKLPTTEADICLNDFERK
jgi:hypothetical protein